MAEQDQISLSHLPLDSISFQYATLLPGGELESLTPGMADLYAVRLGQQAVLEMILIKGGIFHMGSTLSSFANPSNTEETPVHLVSVPAFFISRTPITQAQWQAVSGRLPPRRFKGENLPVVDIPWAGAAGFCRRLSRKSGHAFSLPSEAQWEFACRGGTTTPFHTGPTITTAYANYCGLHTFASEPQGVYYHTTTPPGMFLPNPFGLLDMHGNIWEWCADAWFPDYTNAGSSSDARQGGEPGYRPARGGSWHEPPANCRSATRVRLAEDDHDDYIGFRVAMSVNE